MNLFPGPQGWSVAVRGDAIDQAGQALLGFGYCWDVGNLYDADQGHFLEGYTKLKSFIRNVHLKDGQYIGHHMVWLHFGTGKTDIKGQIEALKADEYKGVPAHRGGSRCGLA